MNQLLNILINYNHNFIISGAAWLVTWIIIFLLSMVITYLDLFYSKLSTRDFVTNCLRFIVQVSLNPCLFLLTIYTIYICLTICIFYINHIYVRHSSLITVLDLIECITYFGLVFSVVKSTKAYLIEWSEKYNHKTFGVILPAISSSLYAIVFFIMMNILTPELHLTNAPEYVLKNIIKALLIAMFGWMFIQIVNTAEQFIIKQYILNNEDLNKVRKINTQLSILKRVIIVLIVAITLASILMLFESIHNLGLGLLTTAGIISAIGAFASQQSLSRLFAGLLIAFTQPIRIGDTIIIDKELGQVEEISLSYIVVKLWDLRRLIVPTDHITSNGLQNLTRETSDLLGTTFFYTDYTLPVDIIRNKFFEILNDSPLWDKKNAAFDVTDIKETCMEIRGLMSAANSSQLWELRCQIREQLIAFIVEKYPHCLAKPMRTIMRKLVSSQRIGYSFSNLKPILSKWPSNSSILLKRICK